jgi:digeranylgeranylglycerophospholipid reductase
MKQMMDIAIVGAGPAGSNCAYTLAQRGIYATLFDHSFPREKPCGGMMGTIERESFSILEEFPIEHSEIDLMRVISPSQKIWNIDMTKNKLLGFSRLRFDQYLLNKALSEGANLIEEKVIALQKNGKSWKVITQKESYEVGTIVGADGVNSLIRKSIVGSLNKTDMGACFGHIFRDAKEKTVTIKFLPKIEGYIWVIPRGDNTSIGGGTTKLNNFRRLKDEVNLFTKAGYSQMENVSEWAALIPNAKNQKILLSRMAGLNWVLIGDAAGHVSPISGSGIAYALMDGELAAEAIAEGHVEQFNKMWIELYGKQLLLDTRLRGLIYQTPILELYCMTMKLHNSISFS